MELLLSLQSAEELRLAAEFSWTWLDLKNPFAGSLGCPDADTAAEFLHTAAELEPLRNSRLSIALGELVDGLVERANGEKVSETFKSPIDPKILNEFHYIKVALADTSHPRFRGNWLRLAGSLSKLLADPAKLILVHYADNHLANSVGWEETVRASELLGCEYVLVDTFDKRKGSLLDWRSLAELRKFAIDSKTRGLKLSLAGSLRIEDFSPLEETGASILGIRGAACQEGSRVSALCRDRLRSLSNYYSKAEGSLRGL